MGPLGFAAISGGSNILGGIVGNIMSAGDRAEAERLLEEASALYDIPIPDLTKELINYQYSTVGDISPVLLNKLPEEAQQAVALRVDKGLRNKILQGIAQQKEFVDSGQDATSRANLFDLMRKISGDTQARQASIKSQVPANSGASLMLQMMASQQADDQASKTGLQIAADQENRRREALQSMIANTSDLNKQDVDEAKWNAESQRALQEQLLKNSINRSVTNTAAKNRAIESNIAARQAARDKNTQWLKDDEYRKKIWAQQQAFANRLGLANGKASTMTARANQKMGNAAATAGMYSQIGSGIGQGIGTYGQFDQNEAIRDNTSAIRGRAPASVDNPLELGSDEDYPRTAAGFQMPSFASQFSRGRGK